MSRILAGCPDQPLPDAADADRPVLTTAPPRAPSTGQAFENCAAARAAGAAPLRRGDPGYASSMDGDGDGVACE
jgi:hypothetical protein